MDWTGQYRSIVFLHTPSWVQIFTVRGSFVMIRFPLGDLNGGLITVLAIRWGTLTMRLDQQTQWGVTAYDGK